MKNIVIALMMLIHSVTCVFNTEIKKNKTYSKTMSIKKDVIEVPSKFVATKSDYQTRPLPPNSVIMGYLMEGQMPTDSQFKKMTNVGISFLQATNNKGKVAMTTGWEILN